MCKLFNIKKRFFNVVLILAVIFIAGSCKQPSGNEKKPPAPVPVERSVVTATETQLKTLSINGQDLINEANRGDDWPISMKPVENDDELLTLIAEANNPKVSITVSINGKAVSDWKALPLVVGNNGILIKITSADGSKNRVIRVSIIRKAEEGKDVSLQWLNFWRKPTGLEYLLSKFDTDGNYDRKKVFNQPDYAKIDVSATDENASIVVKLNNTPVNPGAAGKTWYPMNLKEGDNTISVTVTSKDRTVTKTYTIKMYRYTADEDDVDLSELTSEGSSILVSGKLEKKTYPATKKTITIKAKAKSPLSKVAIGRKVETKEGTSDTQEATKTIPITEGKQIIPIYVLAASGNEKRYDFIVFRTPSDARLKSLNITHDEKPVLFDFNPAITDMNMSVPNPSTEKPLVITAQAEAGSTVQIDGVDIPSDGYKVKEFSAGDKLEIVVSDVNGLKKTYTLHFTSQTPTSTVEVKVFSAVGQSVVAGTKVSAYEAGTPTAIETKTSDKNGACTFRLETGKLYDFVAEKPGRCGSRVQNYYVLGADGEKLQMIQRAGTVGEKHEAPSIIDIKLQYDSEAPSELKAGDTLDGNQIGENSKLLVRFDLPSRFISPDSSTGNFGIACEVGRSATDLSNFITTRKVDTTPAADGYYTATISLKNAGIPNGSDTLFITAYDTAENRVEYRLPLNFLAKTGAAIDLTGASIEHFYINTQRYPRPLNTFGTPRRDREMSVLGVPKHDNRETSFRTLMTFWVKDKNEKDLPISGYEIYRRVYEEGAGPRENWKLVATKLYDGLYKGLSSKDTSNQAVWGRHWGNDTDNDLTEMTVYQYKIVAFIDNKNRIESPIATTALYPAFNLKLLSPSDNGMINRNNIKNTEFKFKLSDTTLWDAKYSDSFTFGLIVSEKSNLSSIPYCVKLRYNFNAVDDERLSISDWDSKARKTYWRTLKDLKTVRLNDTGDYAVPGTIRVEDLISFDKSSGVVTIKAALLNRGYFNSWNRNAFGDAMEAGANYQWDVQDYGDDAGSVKDDVSASFLKEWPMLDSKTGEPIPNYPEIPRARTGSNFFDGENAINGRFSFSIE
ncbi:MAG: dentilisin complex subunit PrcA [Treponemataceae bacterium]